jgi:hypothetical protein
MYAVLGGGLLGFGGLPVETLKVIGENGDCVLQCSQRKDCSGHFGGIWRPFVSIKQSVDMLEPASSPKPWRSTFVLIARASSKTASVAFVISPKLGISAAARVCLLISIGFLLLFSADEIAH